MRTRAVAFLAVGTLGFAVQLAMLAWLTELWHWPVAAATAAAVESAIIVNFIWHERWTWGDRVNRSTGRIERLLRFHAANGLASLLGTVGLTWAIAHSFGLHALVANAISVAVMAAINYHAADRWVFRSSILVASVGLLPAQASAAELKAATLAAWATQVATVEHVNPEPAPEMLTEPRGRTIDVPGGTISEWRGTMVIANHTVTDVVDALVSSPTLPAAEEVLESRVLARHGDALKTYMKLTRRMLVTATYDTEHDVHYQRLSPALATSRSVSTRITETGGEDRGFMWRLNSYWRYQQVGADVRIDVRTLTLSRRVPWVLRPVAMPIVERIGRESIRSTLSALARFLEEERRTNRALARVR